MEAKVHGYAGPAGPASPASPLSPGLYRDPQLLADPTRFAFDEEAGYHPAHAHAPYGAVNAHVGYAQYGAGAAPAARPVYMTHPAVVHERYCVCAPQTRAERRLLVTVVVLAVISVGLLATLCSVLPSLLCGGDCKEGANGGGGGGLADWLPILGGGLRRAAAGLSE